MISPLDYEILDIGEVLRGRGNKATLIGLAGGDLRRIL